MSSIQIKRRSELGFHSDPRGYFLLINNSPALQIHFYQDYFTIFWLGTTSIYDLLDCLRETVEELSEIFGVSRDRLSSVMTQYGRNKGVTSLPYHIYPSYSPIYRKEIIQHNNFIQNNSPLITFARFDINSRIPIVLWADLMRSTQSEIGFSCINFIPASIFKLFKLTCSIKLSDDEFRTIKTNIPTLIPKTHLP
jgi:hypothetical protein